MKKRIFAALFAAFAFAAVFTAVSASCKKEQPNEYAVVIKTLASPFWRGIQEGVEGKAKELGIKVDVYAANSEDDIEGQVQLLENCISKGYKVIGVSPISPVNLNAVIAQAAKKGVYVINIDEMVNLENLKSQGGAVQGFCATDNVEVGRIGAGYIVSLLPGGGQVAIIEGMAGNKSGEDRKNGAAEAFRNASGFEIAASQAADWDRTKAFDVANSIITRFPDIKGIYCCNDTMAMGALEAVKRSGKTIIVVGTDGNEDAVLSVKAGELAATVAQDTRGIGGIGVQLMYDTYKNKPKIDPNAEVPFVGAKAQLVTK
ncbi:MAG: D-allose transporter substrate-binding protein [Spirochaetaceae bacterium]|jgi:D-allose transport system substrate-binding protein|nr:D-allose transporter substrate-binding protein [Spirochaetaceae bacterium]